MLFDRTFHPDEANQAFTVGRLLATGHYTYQPTDHHGPTLYYAAAPLQRAFGHTTTASLDGTLLRCTPLLFALLGLVALFFAVRRILHRLGDCAPRTATAVALLPVLLVGTAPIFVFYATNFIQETLLVSFTLLMASAATGYALPGTRLKRGTWALLFGIAAGLAFATKETCCLTFAALVLAAVPFAASAALVGLAAPGEPRRRNALRHFLLTVLGFALTAILLFSAFGQDWGGVYNAFIAAPIHYLGRAAGDAAASEGADWHVHPWHQYLTWLFLQPPPFTHVFALGHLLFLGIPTALYTQRRRLVPPLVKVFWGLCLYTALLATFYSLIPYKTPWCALQIIVPLLLATAFGYILVFQTASDFFAQRRLPRVAARLPPLLVLLLPPLSLVLQFHVPGLLKLHRDPDAASIPYNYAHASPESIQLAQCVADAVAASADARPFIAVALPPADTWPFPWYNRKLEHLTGYWTSFGDLVALEKAGAKPTVVVVPMTEGHLVQPLFPHLTHTKRFFMRPGVRVRVFW